MQKEHLKQTAETEWPFRKNLLTNDLWNDLSNT